MVGVVAFGFGIFANDFVSKYEISAIKPAQAAVGGKNSKQLIEDFDFRLAVGNIVKRYCSVKMRKPGQRGNIHCNR